MQCPTRVESYVMGSHTSSFINKSAENLLWTWGKKQSPLLILIIGEGKTYLFQVWTSSSLQLFSLISTALHISRAVLKRRFEPKRLNAGFLAFSRLELISMKSTALHVTRAVTKHRIQLRWLPANFLAFSRFKPISLIATALKPPGQSINAQQNKDDRRRHSAKEAAALMRQPLHIFYGKIPLLQASFTTILRISAGSVPLSGTGSR